MAKIFTDISELLTNNTLASECKLRDITEGDLGILRDAWLYVDNGKVAEFGDGQTPQKYLNHAERVSCKNKLVMPGLIDSHTHPVFFGDRSNEFYMRLNGKTYGDIALSGG